MKILHLSFHYGCISDLNAVFSKLGHSIAHIFCKDKLPYSISPDIAQQNWQANKDFYNSFDIIITSDTVSLSYIFTLHLTELIPHLIILNSNRFTYAMEGNTHFIQTTKQAVQNLHKVTYIPYTDFERIWTAKHNVFIHERAIQPIGRYADHINSPELMQAYFENAKKEYTNTTPDNTIFIQNYYNHTNFMDLTKYITDHSIPVTFGSYSNLKEIVPYKALVVLPDAFSKYFTYESIQEQLVVLLPSQDFLMELVHKPGYFFNIEGSSGLLTKELVNLCEWYKYPEARIYFHSFEHLITLLKTLTPEVIAEKKKWCAFYGRVIEEEHMLQWKHVLDKITLLSTSP